jgi:hypothetical protein
MQSNRERLLRLAFWAGAVSDALALIPILFPPVAFRMWGIDTPGPSGWYALGSGASLMLGWTGLLVWATRRPAERAFVAPLTILVIAGFVVTEVVCVVAGAVHLEKMLPTWLVQAVLLGLLGVAYCSRGEQGVQTSPARMTPR